MLYFFSKMQLVLNCYTVVLYEPISSFICTKTQPYSFPIVGLRFFTRYRNWETCLRVSGLFSTIFQLHWDRRVIVNGSTLKHRSHELNIAPPVGFEPLTAWLEGNEHWLYIITKIGGSKFLQWTLLSWGLNVSFEVIGVVCQNWKTEWQTVWVQLFKASLAQQARYWSKC